MKWYENFIIMSLVAAIIAFQIVTLMEIQSIKQKQVNNADLIESMDYHVTEVSGYMSGHIGEVVTINNERVK